VLLTRSPLSPGPKAWFSLDLHVLSAPPAFVLSQDQTLREDGLHVRPKTGCKLLQFELELKGHTPRGMTGFKPRARRREASTFAHAAEFSKTGAVGGVKKPPTRVRGLRDRLGTEVVSDSRPKALLVELQGLCYTASRRLGNDSSAGRIVKKPGT
jgi:hypothetical protein